MSEIDEEEKERRAKVEARELFIVNVLKFVVFLLIVMIVLTAGTFLRSFVNQNATDKATDAAELVQKTSARDLEASLDVQKTLHDILNSLENAADEPSLNNQAIIDALQAISRIEGHLCGGPCEASP